jgi:hypothetical protein
MVGTLAGVWKTAIGCSILNKSVNSAGAPWDLGSSHFLTDNELLIQAAKTDVM